MEPTETNGPRPLADIQEDLQQPIPQRLLESKRLQGNQITFCPWYKTQKILDHYTGGFWESEIREKRTQHYELVDEKSGQVTPHDDFLITVRIYITAAEGRFYREGTGIEPMSKQSYGDYQSTAESQAFRRACARWGLGVHLYED